MSLITGAGQVTLGALSYPNDRRNWNGNYISASQRNLSLINIGLGTSTIILSAWNLIANRKPKEKSLSWDVYSFPTPEGNVGVSFILKKRL
ncbi:MAG: hypothetical protein JKX84_02260 [Flavobacteriales bacterium]|nr:hypothetical protein [Flavobacteriales bacterium]